MLKFATTKPVRIIAKGDIQAPAEEIAVTKNFGKGRPVTPATAPKSIDIQIGFKNTLKENLLFSLLLGIKEDVPNEYT